MTRKTVLDMWAEANEQVELIPTRDLADELDAGQILLLDVRLPIEIERRGTIAGSVPVARQVIEWWADPDSPTSDRAACSATSSGASSPSATEAATARSPP